MSTTSISSDLLLSYPFPIENDSSVDAISSLSDIMTVKTTRIISKSFATTTGNSVRNECLRVAARVVTSEMPYDGHIRPQSPETRF